MERRVVVKLDNGQVLGTIWTNRMLDVDEAMELLEIEPTDYDKKFVAEGYKLNTFMVPMGRDSISAK